MRLAWPAVSLRRSSGQATLRANRRRAASWSLPRARRPRPSQPHIASLSRDLYSPVSLRLATATQAPGLVGFVNQSRTTTRSAPAQQRPASCADEADPGTASRVLQQTKTTSPPPRNRTERGGCAQALCRARRCRTHRRGVDARRGSQEHAGAVPQLGLRPSDNAAAPDRASSRRPAIRLLSWRPSGRSVLPTRQAAGEWGVGAGRNPVDDHCEVAPAKLGGTLGVPEPCHRDQLEEEADVQEREARSERAGGQPVEGPTLATRPGSLSAQVARPQVLADYVLPTWTPVQLVRRQPHRTPHGVMLTQQIKEPVDPQQDAMDAFFVARRAAPRTAHTPRRPIRTTCAD